MYECATRSSVVSMELHSGARNRTPRGTSAEIWAMRHVTAPAAPTRLSPHGLLSSPLSTSAETRSFSNQNAGSIGPRQSTPIPSPEIPTAREGSAALSSVPRGSTALPRTLTPHSRPTSPSSSSPKCGEVAAVRGRPGQASAPTSKARGFVNSPLLGA